MSDIVERLKDGWDRSLRTEASAEILRLRAENEKLQWELGKALDTLVVHDAVCAENEKLRAALKPFAGFSARYTQCFEETSQILLIKVCDLRAAAAALKETGDE